MNSSNSAVTTAKWEVVGKPNKKGKSPQVSTKNQRKALQENMPKIEPADPVKESPTIYDAFTQKETAAPQNNHNAMPNKETPKVPTTDLHKRPTKKKGESKGQRKDAGPLTLQQAVLKIDKGDLETILAKDQATFPDNPSVWLKDLASYMNLKLDPVPEKDPVFSDQPKDFPASELPESIKTLLVSTLKKCATPTLDLFLDHCIQSMISDMGKGVSTYGHRIFIQLLSYEKPEIVGGNLQKYLEHLKSHKNRSMRCLSILWAVGQAGYRDLAVGLKVWKEIMLPCVQIRALSQYAVHYVDSILSTHSDPKSAYGSLTFREFFPIMDQVFSTKLNLPNQLQKTLLSVYPRIREISYGAHPETTLRHFFPSFLARLKPENSEKFQAELLSCLVYCLSHDKHCFSVWRQMYVKQFSQSSYLLQHIHENWATVSRQLDCTLLRETMRTFSVTNGEMQGKVDAESMNRSTVACNALLSQNSPSYSFLKMCILLILSILIGLILSDIYTSKGFQKSRTRNLLHKSGALSLASYVWTRFLFYGSKLLQWCQANIPYYYARLCAVIGPYITMLWQKLYEGALYVLEVTKPQQEWLKVQGKLFLEWLQEVLPVVWATVSHYGSIALEFIITYGTIVYQQMAHLVHITGTWLHENVYTQKST